MQWRSVMCMVSACTVGCGSGSHDHHMEQWGVVQGHMIVTWNKQFCKFKQTMQWLYCGSGVMQECN